MRGVLSGERDVLLLLLSRVYITPTACSALFKMWRVWSVKRVRGVLLGDGVLSGDGVCKVLSGEGLRGVAG